MTSSGTIRDNYIDRTFLRKFIQLIGTTILLLCMCVGCGKNSTVATAQDSADYRVALCCNEQTKQWLEPCLKEVLAKILEEKNEAANISVDIKFYNTTNYADPMNNGFADLMLDAIDQKADTILYLLTDEAMSLLEESSTAIFENGLFCELPKDIADPTCGYRVNLSNAPFLVEQEHKGVSLYGCIWNYDDEAVLDEEQENTLDIILRLKDASLEE